MRVCFSAKLSDMASDARAAKTRPHYYRIQLNAIGPLTNWALVVNMLSLHTIIPPCLLLCAVIEALQLPPFPEFKINSDIVPRDQRSRTFADIRIGNGLIDWEPYDLDIQKYPIIEVIIPSDYSNSYRLLGKIY